MTSGVLAHRQGDLAVVLSPASVLLTRAEPVGISVAPGPISAKLRAEIEEHLGRVFASLNAQCARSDHIGTDATIYDQVVLRDGRIADLCIRVEQEGDTGIMTVLLTEQAVFATFAITNELLHNSSYVEPVCHTGWFTTQVDEGDD